MSRIRCYGSGETRSQAIWSPEGLRRKSFCIPLVTSLMALYWPSQKRSAEEDDDDGVPLSRITRRFEGEKEWRFGERMLPIVMKV